MVTVEQIMKDKITESWQMIAPRFTSYDPLKSAKINKKHLRKIISSHCIPISDEHFDQ